MAAAVDPNVDFLERDDTAKTWIQVYRDTRWFNYLLMGSFVHHIPPGTPTVFDSTVAFELAT